MATIEEIESKAGFRDQTSLESTVFLPVLAATVTLSVYFDNGFTTVSPRQLDCLNRFLEHGPELIGQIKQALFEQWEEYDHFYTDDIDFEYETPEQAFAVCELLCLRVDSDRSPYPDHPVLAFKSEWDPEHGAEVWFFDGRFRFR